ncbi:MAG: septum formation protein Maf [Clostridia bacterium]|nr:septum formation protein Maf [Clostridia bacterium]
MKVILASNSPRRKQLLEDAGLTFSVIPSNFNESENDGLSPQIYSQRLAENKAKSVYNGNDCAVIGADTIVCLNGEILGKPKDKKDAINMLKKLSGKKHLVITGYAVIINGKMISGHEETEVEFNELSSSLISEYVESGLPLDKAGAYGIQDGYPLVKNVKGSYDNVVGLPVNKILKILGEITKV